MLFFFFWFDYCVRHTDFPRCTRCIVCLALLMSHVLSTNAFDNKTRQVKVHTIFLRFFFFNGTEMNWTGTIKAFVVIVDWLMLWSTITIIRIVYITFYSDYLPARVVLFSRLILAELSQWRHSIDVINRTLRNNFLLHSFVFFFIVYNSCVPFFVPILGRKFHNRRKQEANSWKWTGKKALQNTLNELNIDSLITTLIFSSTESLPVPMALCVRVCVCVFYILSGNLFTRFSASHVQSIVYNVIFWFVSLFFAVYLLSIHISDSLLRLVDESTELR